MSTALASARRRRAGPETVAPTPGARQTTPQPSFPGSPQQSNMGGGLTLPQVIAVVDKRLSTLEVFMQNQSQPNENQPADAPEGLKEILDEYAARFDIIADELALLKDTILKLQTYTMEVNKALMDDRIRILSEETTPLEAALHSLNGHQ